MVDRPKQTAAFTFIEVVVVVVIVLAIGALVIPMVGGMASSRLRAAADLLVADLCYAQMQSIAHPDDLRVVVFDANAGRYLIAPASDTGTPVTNPVDRMPWVVTFGDGRAGQLEGVWMSNLDVGGDGELGFDMYGQLDQTTPATVTLSAGGRSVTITIDPTTGEPTVGDLQ